MRLPNLRFEAAVLRGALLAGLLREDDVTEWASGHLWWATDEDAAELASVAATPRELTALREALRTIAEPVAEADVSRALRQVACVTFRTERWSAAGSLRVLSDLRREGVLPADIAASAKELEDRGNMASVGMTGAIMPSIEDVTAVLTIALDAASYVLPFADRQEGAAFLGALSRAVARERRAESGDDLAVDVAREVGSGVVLVLHAGAWEVARRVFAPLPVCARLPYPRAGAQRVSIQLGHVTWGAEDARQFLEAN